MLKLSPNQRSSMSKPIKFSHNIASMQLKESDEGEIILPSEVSLINFNGTLRQFIILARRLTSHEYLDNFKNTEVMDVRKLTYVPPGFTPIETNFPYIGMTLKILPSNQDLSSFSKLEGEKFFSYLISIIGHSEMPNQRGTRCAFIQNFKQNKTLEFGDVFESKILLGTSIFFNDYRVKTNYPNCHEVLFDICQKIYEGILSEFPNLEIEINSYTLENENDEALSDLKA